MKRPVRSPVERSARGERQRQVEDDDASPSVIGSLLVDGKVGEGTHGTVYRATDEAGATCAVKRIKAAREGISTTAYREMTLMRELRHRNIVRLLDVLVTEGRHLHLVFEFVDGDLSQRIREARQLGQAFKPRVVRMLMWQLLDALAYLKASYVMHRDIKPANILVASDWSLKVTDFGLARLYDQPLRPLGLDGPVVTGWYRAPELLLGAQSYTPAIDCWAAGCILVELLTLKAAFPGREAKAGELQEELLQLVFRCIGLPSPEVRTRRSELANSPRTAHGCTLTVTSMPTGLAWAHIVAALASRLRLACGGLPRRAPRAPGSGVATRWATSISWHGGLDTWLADVSSVCTTDCG